MGVRGLYLFKIPQKNQPIGFSDIQNGCLCNTCSTDTNTKTLSVIVDSDSCTNEKPGQKEQICIDITIKKYEQISSKTPPVDCNETK